MLRRELRPLLNLDSTVQKYKMHNEMRKTQTCYGWVLQEEENFICGLHIPETGKIKKRNVKYIFRDVVLFVQNI